MVFPFSTSRRRERLRLKPFPGDWRQILEQNVQVFKRLSAEDQKELEGHVRVFLEEKHFEGCGGLELNDEIRVTIAGQACLLLLHRDTDYYPNLHSILVYPTGYRENGERYIGGGLWEDGPEDRLGHTARELRALVLSWDDSLHGARNASDGDNVVLHEFAHQLDFENRSADGTPALATTADYLTWARVMSAELEALRQAESSGLPTLLDQYGATNPTEFFAVATEAFFERPRALKALHPELYAELQRFFQQEPTNYSLE